MKCHPQTTELQWLYIKQGAYCEAMTVWTVSLDEDPLMATFAVFMHTMLSAALDTSFLASIVQNEEGMIIPTSI